MNSPCIHLSPFLFSSPDPPGIRGDTGETLPQQLSQIIDSFLMVMAPWSAVSTLVDFLGLGDEHSKELELALSQFSALPENDKIEARAPVAERILPLIFGENAITSKSPDYESQRQVPW